MHGHRRAWTLLTVALALVTGVVIVLFLSGRPGPDLEALRADPVARWVPAGATLTRTHETGSGTTLGKPVYARITRVFRSPDPDADLDASATLARRHGWQVEDRRADAVHATRHVPGYRLELTVVRATVTGVPGNLFVYLAAYPA